MRCVLLIPIWLLFFLGMSGWLYQTIATAIDRHRFPPPGVRVDIGGYRLHLHCLGPIGGDLTVILKAGLGGHFPNLGADPTGDRQDHPGLRL